MQFVDSHAHLTYEPYQGQIDSVIAKARQVGVNHIMTIGTDLLDSIKAVALAKHYSGIISAAIGIHPHEAEKFSPADISDMGRIVEEGSVVAIGETGLDYYYDFSPKNRQIDLFQAQLELARKYSLPVIIHCRDAFDDCLAILNDFHPEPQKVIFHCYSGDQAITKKVLDLGALISFSGTITFKKSNDIQASAIYAPLNRIMIETDSPYLSPAPHRSVKPNEPTLVIHTAAKLAELKQIPLEDIAKATTDNFKKYITNFAL